MVHFWTLFCRSVLEQSSVLWNSSLSQENIINLERTQKAFAKLVLKDAYISYEDAILKLDLLTLEERRRKLDLQFAKNGIKKNTLTDLFPVKEKLHSMTVRQEAKYETKFANTQRLKKSTIINLQSMLNKEDSLNKIRMPG